MVQVFYFIAKRRRDHTMAVHPVNDSFGTRQFCRLREHSENEVVNNERVKGSLIRYAALLTW